MANLGQKFPGERYTPQEARALVDAAAGDSAIDARNQALIVTLYRAGLRGAEACALVPSDVDFNTGEVHVRRGKGGKDRRVAIDSDALVILRLWRERRERMGFNGRQPLFPTFARDERGNLKGQPLDTSHLRRLVKRLARRAGIEKRAHVHGLRHSFACELHEEGTDLRIISALLGHSSSAVTARYIDHLLPAAAIDAARARSGWR